VVSIILAVTFVTGQVSASQISSNPSNNTLAASIVSDSSINPARSKPVQNDIAEQAEPGAIANGIPLLELAQGNLPAKIKWNYYLERDYGDEIRESINLAIKLGLSAISEKRVPPRHLKRVKDAIDNLIALRDHLTQIGYLFNADIRGKEDYRVGFYFQGQFGYSIELINRLYSISPKRLAQYLFHECVPGKGMITERTDHRIIYNEIQSAIFGQDEVIALKGDLRGFINERLSGQMPSRPITENLARREVEEYTHSPAAIIHSVTGLPDIAIATLMCLYLTGKLSLRNPSDPSMGAVELIGASDDRISYIQATSALISMGIKVQFGLASIQREILESFLLSDRTYNDLTAFSDLAIAKLGKGNDAGYSAKVRNAFQIARNELLATQGTVAKLTPGYLPHTVFGNLQRNQGIGRALRIIAELNEQGFSLTESHADLLTDYFIGAKSLAHVISNMNIPDTQKKLIIVSKIVAMKIAGFNNLNDEQRYTIELFLREHNDPYYFVRLGKTQRDFDALILQASEKAKASKPATQDEYWKLFFSNLGIDTNESPWQRAVQSLCENPNNSLWVKEMFYKVLSAASMEMRDGMRGTDTSRGSPTASDSSTRDKMPEEKIPTSEILAAQVSEDLPVRAQVFRANLIQILTKHPDQLFFMGIETDIGESQKAQIMPIYKAIYQIESLTDGSGKKLFPNLMVRRARAEELTSMVAELNKNKINNHNEIEFGELDLNRTFIGARKFSVDNKLYDSITGEGRAWISAIDDSRPGDYLPVLEAITVNMMAYLNADVAAINNFYNAISDKPIDPGKLQDMIRNRIIYILPRATKFDTKQLRELYELAQQVYVAA